MILSELLDKLSKLPVVSQEKTQLLLETFEEGANCHPFGIFKKNNPKSTSSDWFALNEVERDLYLRLATLRNKVFDQKMKMFDEDGKNNKHQSLVIN